jgi:hypothetical protein
MGHEDRGSWDWEQTPQPRAPKELAVLAQLIATHCECGRELVLCDNGERHCADTLEKFKVKHGYAYGSSRAKEV